MTAHVSTVPQAADPATTRPEDAPTPHTPHLPRSVARDLRLSRRARGLVGLVWSHRDGWTFNVDTLWAGTRNLPAVEGYSALRAAFSEAAAAEYFVPIHDPSPEGCWQRRWTLHRAAAPGWDPKQPDKDFVHVPWEVARDHRVSLRARGLLAERLAEGATLRGVTVAVHRGGIKALARRKPDGKDATTTALDELLAAGYAARERRRDEATGRLSWSLVFRTGPAPKPGLAGPDDRNQSAAGNLEDERQEDEHRAPESPVDNPDPGIPVPTCDDDASSQFTPTTRFPYPGFHDPVSAPYKGSEKGSFQGSEELGVRSVRTAQVGDASASDAAAPSQDQIDSLDARQDSPVRLSEGRGAPKGTRSEASCPRRYSGAPEASEAAWWVLGRLPAEYRRGAPGWVLGRMAERIDRLLADGHLPAQIELAAREIAASRPIGGREHIAALDAVRTAVRTNAHDPQAARARCPGCGDLRRSDELCVACDMDVLEVIEFTDAELDRMATESKIDHLESAH